MSLLNNGISNPEPVTAIPQNGAYGTTDVLINGQSEILEIIAAGAALDNTMSRIVQWVSDCYHGKVSVSIHKVSNDGSQLQLISAQGLQADYIKLIESLNISECPGSCPLAVRTRENIIASDLQAHPSWSGCKDVAAQYDLKACWSVPLLSTHNEVLGVFAIYFDDIKSPGAFDVHLIKLVGHTAAIAMKSHHNMIALQELEARENAAIKRANDDQLNFYRGMLDDAPVMIAVLRGRDMVFDFANEFYMRAVGKRHILGKPLREALPELEGQGLLEILDEVFTTGITYIGNETKIYLNRKEDGGLEEAYFNFAYKQIKNTDGAPEGILVHAVDVSDHVRALRRAEESEQRFRSFVLNSPMPIGIYIGREMRIQTVNEAILRAWEKDSSVIGKTFREALPELEGQPFFQLLDDVYTTGIPYQATEDKVYLMRDGKIQPTYYNFTYTPLRDENGMVYGVMNTATEVTDLVKAKQKLQQAEVRLLNAVDVAELGTWSIDVETQQVDFSNRVKAILGTETNSLTLPDFLGFIHEDDRQKVKGELDNAGGTNGVIDFECRFINRQTEAEHVVHGRAKLFIDENSEFGRINGKLKDITLERMTRKQLEKQVEARTLELQKLNNDLVKLNESLNQFAYVASHDLQEPLRKIHMYSDILQHSYKNKVLDETGLIYLDKILASSQRMSSLIKDLLAFSRVESAEQPKEKVELAGIIHNIIVDYEVLIQQKKATINVGDLPPVQAMPLQMNQLFYNMIGNALKFSKANVPPVVDIHSRILTKDEIEQYSNLKDKEYCEITISDNGIGFNPSFAEQIFVIFQRLNLKEHYEGNGIGLALCKKIVENHEGDISVTSKENEGTTFKIILPLSNL